MQIPYHTVVLKYLSNNVTFKRFYNRLIDAYNIVEKRVK